MKRLHGESEYLLTELVQCGCCEAAMSGGVDHFNTLTSGTPEEIRAMVQTLFETVGDAGGYICACSDHFFEAPVENLTAFADAAKECVY